MRITPAGVVAPLTMKNTYGGDKVGQRDISILETNFNPSLIDHKNMGNIHVVRKRGVTNFPSNSNWCNTNYVLRKRDVYDNCIYKRRIYK